MRGCRSIAEVTASAKRARSTASAEPPGTAVASASRSSNDPERRSSSLSSHEAEPGAFDFKELLQTSSANRSVRCAGVTRAGRIS